jgi:RNA recognition motif-containing protein
MSVRLFVGNLTYDVTEAELREYLSPAGTVVSVRIPTDRETGKPRGFAFVEFGEAAQAEDAIRRFNQQPFKGRPLVINEARPREEGAGPRLSSPARPTWVGEQGPAGPSQQKRNFGPDAPPRGARKAKGRGPKGERAPKGPLKERVRGQFVSADVDDAHGGQEEDDTPFWARATSENPDEE